MATVALEVGLSISPAMKLCVFKKKSRYFSKRRYSQSNKPAYVSTPYTSSVFKNRFRFMVDAPLGHLPTKGHQAKLPILRDLDPSVLRKAGCCSF